MYILNIKDKKHKKVRKELVNLDTLQVLWYKEKLVLQKISEENDYGTEQLHQG